MYTKHSIGNGRMKIAILCMSWIPSNLKWIGRIAAEKKWQHRFFFDDQGKLWSVVGPCRISNSSKLLCMSLLPVSMKKIRSNTAEN